MSSSSLVSGRLSVVLVVVVVVIVLVVPVIMVVSFTVWDLRFKTNYMGILSQVYLSIQIPI